MAQDKPCPEALFCLFVNEQTHVGKTEKRMKNLKYKDLLASDLFNFCKEILCLQKKCM